MKKVVRILVFFITIGLVFSKLGYGIEQQNGSKLKFPINKDSTFQKITQKDINDKDTVYIKIIQNPLKSSNLTTNMPWLVALGVGLMTIIANLIINASLRRLNRESIDKQLATSIQLNKLQFKSTIASNNRQVWINSIRDYVSDYISRVISIHINVAKTGSIDFLINSQEYKELNALRWKIVLMLNSRFEEEHRELETLIDTSYRIENFNESFYDNLDKIKDKVQQIIKKEWEVIKNTNV